MKDLSYSDLESAFSKIQLVFVSYVIFCNHLTSDLIHQL